LRKIALIRFEIEGGDPKMPKIILAFVLAAFLITACSTVPNSPAPTPTPQPTSTNTPVPPTATLDPTATSTPMPITIRADNFQNLAQVSSANIDQASFLGLETEKIDYFKDESNIPNGDVRSAYFESYRWLENGDLAGLLLYFPLKCGDRQFGKITKRSCSYDRYYQSMVNLSKRTTLWKQFQPVNMAGPELRKLAEELGLKDFKPRLIYGYRLAPIIEWSEDGKQIVVPIDVVYTTLIRDTMTGATTQVLPWGPSPSWIGAISPDKSRFAYITASSGSGLDSLKILNLKSEKVESQFPVPGLTTDLAWANDSSKIAVGTRKSSVSVFELGTKSTIVLQERRLDLSEKNQGGITRLKFSDDGARIAFTENYLSKTDEKISRMAIFSIETRREENSYPADFYQNGEIIWARDGSYAVTVTDFQNGRIVLMDADRALEIPLTAPKEVADYKSRIFTSLISLNEDQTRLTLVRSLLNDAVVTVYEVKQ
jgi:hypothetical protein